jgi:hypothetical protein
MTTPGPQTQSRRTLAAPVKPSQAGADLRQGRGIAITTAARPITI